MERSRLSFIGQGMLQKEKKFISVPDYVWWNNIYKTPKKLL